MDEETNKILKKIEFQLREITKILKEATAEPPQRIY